MWPSSGSVGLGHVGVTRRDAARGCRRQPGRRTRHVQGSHQIARPRRFDRAGKFGHGRIIELAKRDGTLVNLGVPQDPLAIPAHALLHSRRLVVAGSLIGSIGQTQEMLDFCAANGIGAQVEIIDADSIDDAYDRLEGGDVRAVGRAQRVADRVA